MLEALSFHWHSIYTGGLCPCRELLRTKWQHWSICGSGKPRNWEAIPTATWSDSEGKSQLLQWTLEMSFFLDVPLLVLLIILDDAGPDSAKEWRKFHAKQQPSFQLKQPAQECRWGKLISRTVLLSTIVIVIIVDNRSVINNYYALDLIPPSQCYVLNECHRAFQVKHQEVSQLRPGHDEEKEPFWREAPGRCLRSLWTRLRRGDWPLGRQQPLVGQQKGQEEQSGRGKKGKAMEQSEGWRQRQQEGNSPWKADETEENQILGLILKYLDDATI